MIIAAPSLASRLHHTAWMELQSTFGIERTVTDHRTLVLLDNGFLRRDGKASAANSASMSTNGSAATRRRHIDPGSPRHAAGITRATRTVLSLSGRRAGRR